MDKLLKALEGKQAAEGLNQRELAQKLGVSDTYLILLKQGKRQFGVKILRAIGREFPDLQLLVFEYIANKAS